MKEENSNYESITVEEVWQPSVQLRYYKKVIYKDNGSVNVEIVLQQLHTSNLGNREWKDVPLVKD